MHRIAKLRVFLVLLVVGNVISAEQSPEVKITQENGNDGSFETTVVVKKPITAASSLTVRNRDLKLRPTPRPADVIAVTPGIFVVQHAGGGKANQYFVRGFDIDHGTDLALFVDGVPVNLVSHGHGQGYSDLHWIPSELVRKIEILKGPYFPHIGNFGTAGSINLVTENRFDENFGKLTTGMFGTFRGASGATVSIGKAKWLVIGEGYGTDGPFKRPEVTRRYNLLSKVTYPLTKHSRVSLLATAYTGSWNASGQIPNRAIVAGTLDRFGTLDPNEGGNSQRHSLVGVYETEIGDQNDLSLLAYGDYYHLNLFSNFTFFSADPVDGDMIVQSDNRLFTGAQGRFRHRRIIAGKDTETTVGIQFRYDDVTNSLRKAPSRILKSTTTYHDIGEKSLAAYLNEDITWLPWLRTVLGLRVDHLMFNATDNVTQTDLGSKNETLFLPKASVVLSPLPDLEFYLNYGIGYHSNDARGILDPTQPATPVAKAYGYEAGARTKLFAKLDIGAAFFLLYSDSELVFVGDEGTTEASGSTRRLGTEVEFRYEILPWLFADLDVNLTKAELRSIPESENSVPNAPNRIISGGISVRHPKGYFGRFGFFHIGDRSATEDSFLTAEGFTRFDLNAGYRTGNWEFELAVQNLFNTEWREAQFATTSRLSGENSAADCPAGTRPQADNGAFIGCEEVNFTPGSPINFRVSATYYF